MVGNRIRTLREDKDYPTQIIEYTCKKGVFEIFVYIVQKTMKKQA